jgi:predicted PurR-regulated permease PerM
VGGILGMLFVVPIAAILKVVIGEFVASIKK